MGDQLQLLVDMKQHDILENNAIEMGLMRGHVSNSLGNKGGHIEKGMNPLYEFKKNQGKM